MPRRPVPLCLPLLLALAPLPLAAQPPLAVPVVGICGDGQTADMFSSTVTGLKANGDGFLAVRSGPGSNYAKIDELHNGDVVFTLLRKGPWHGVIYGARSRTFCRGARQYPTPESPQGWVHGNWLKDLAG